MAYVLPHRCSRTRSLCERHATRAALELVRDGGARLASLARPSCCRAVWCCCSSSSWRGPLASQLFFLPLIGPTGASVRAPRVPTQAAPFLDPGSPATTRRSLSEAHGQLASSCSRLHSPLLQSSAFRSL